MLLGIKPANFMKNEGMRIMDLFKHMRATIPLELWDMLKYRGIVKHGLDDFVSDAIKEKLERDDKLSKKSQETSNSTESIAIH